MESTMEKYRAYLEGQELAGATICIYVRYAQEIEKYTKGDIQTKKNIIAYKKFLEEGMAPSTVNLAVSAVNRYLRFSGYGECAVKGEKLQKRRSLENVISVEEYKRMLAATDSKGREKYYFIIKILAQTGIRISELKYFTVEALEERKIQIKNKGKIREIYIPDMLGIELKKYCERKGILSGVIFCGRKNRPIGRTAVYKMIVQIGKEADIPEEKVYPHSFRHLFAVTYMKRYGNIAELADIMGHSDLETTRIYTLTTAEEKRKRMENMGL